MLLGVGEVKARSFVSPVLGVGAGELFLFDVPLEGSLLAVTNPHSGIPALDAGVGVGEHGTPVLEAGVGVGELGTPVLEAGLGVGELGTPRLFTMTLRLERPA